MRHVRDRDQHAEILPLALAVDGVVEVLGGGAVDRDERQRRQVHAALRIGRHHLGRQPLRLPHGVLRELERQVVLAQRDLDLDAGIGGAAQHFLHAGDGLAVRGGLLDDLHDDDLPGLRAVDVRRRHQDVLVDPLVLGDDEHDAALLEQATHHLVIHAFDHLDDLAFGTAAPVGAGLAHGHAVAVQRLVHLARAQEIVFAAGVRHEEAEAVRVALHLADREVELGDDAQLTLAVGEELAVALHRGQAAVKGVARNVPHVQRAFEFGRRHRYAGVLQVGEDRFPRRQQGGVDVAGARPPRIPAIGGGGAAPRGGRGRSGGLAGGLGRF